MADPTTQKGGVFTSTGAAQQINLGWVPNWMRVYNETAIADAVADMADYGIGFYYRTGMNNGSGLVWTLQGSQALAPLTVGPIVANAGFFVLDSSSTTPGARAALTAVTAANPPVVTTAATLPSIGDIVRFDTLNNQPQINGLEFTVTNAGGGTFAVGYINMINSTASTTGFWRRIPYDPIYYPRFRYVTWVGSQFQPKMYFSVTHGYTVGEKIGLRFPGGSAIWGDFAQLDGVTATVIAVNTAHAGAEPLGTAGGLPTNNVVLDIDTTGYQAWNTLGTGGNKAYPTPLTAFTPAHVVPAGDNTAVALAAGTNILGGAFINTAVLGMTLAAGIASPAGEAGDIISWQAGIDFSYQI